MGTSLGAAIDYLVAGLAAPLLVIDPSVIIGDGEPLRQSQSMVTIARRSPSDATGAQGAQLPVALGLNSRDEDYTIPCFIEVRRAGPQYKPARDAAIALFDGVAKFIASDPTFGGALTGGRYAYLDSVEFVQTADAADNGSAGSLRRSYFIFDIRAQNRYTN